MTFRVDAYPTDTFDGTVSQIRLQPVVVQNVTTYGTVIDVPNPELKLKPGMTANVKVEIAKRTDVLRVPNAALRFRPSTDVFAALNQPVPPEALGRRRPAAGGRGGRDAAGGRTAAARRPAAPAASAAAARRRAAHGGRGQHGAPHGDDPGASGRADMARRPGPTRRRRVRGPAAGGRRRPRLRPGADDGTLQGHVARRAEAVHRAHEGSRSGHERVREGAQRARAKPAAAPKGPKCRRESAQTIDALFAPLPAVESRGRAWLFMDHQLKPVNLRLGITDGTNTELLSGELQQNMEVVTSVTGLSATRAQPGAGTGNPLMPGGRGPGGGPQGGRGR